MNPLYFTLAFLSIFIIFGAAMAAWGVRTILRAWSSRDWPTTPGVILTSEIAATSDSDGTAYKPLITYTYTVDGVEHRGDTLAVGMKYLFAGLAYAQRHVKKYPAGTAVPVAYDPCDPRRAVLEPGLSLRNCWQVGFGLAFFLSGVLFAAFWLARR